VGEGGVTGMSAILFPEGGGAAVQVYGTLLRMYWAFLQIYWAFLHMYWALL